MGVLLQCRGTAGGDDHQAWLTSPGQDLWPQHVQGSRGQGWQSSRPAVVWQVHDSMLAPPGTQDGQHASKVWGGALRLRLLDGCR